MFGTRWCSLKMTGIKRKDDFNTSLTWTKNRIIIYHKALFNTYDTSKRMKSMIWKPIIQKCPPISWGSHIPLIWCSSSSWLYEPLSQSTYLLVLHDELGPPLQETKNAYELLDYTTSCWLERQSALQWGVVRTFHQAISWKINAHFKLFRFL